MKRLRRLAFFTLAASAILLGADAPAQLRIQTVVPAAANTTVQDEDGDYPAYIVIRSSEVGILTGHYLTDAAAVPNRWQVPFGYILTSGQEITIFASGKDRRPDGPGGELHTNFTYPCSVPYCGLYNVQLNRVHDFADSTDYCLCRGEDLIHSKSIVRVLIPEKDIGLSWVQPEFNDTDWMRGTLGVGYDIGTCRYRDDLILHHTMDRADVTEGGTVIDVSGPTLHHGAIAGGLENPMAQINEGLDFPGEAENHVRVDHHAELNPGTGDFTVSLWYNPDREFRTFDEGFEFLAFKGGLSENMPGWAIYRNVEGTSVQVAIPHGVYTVPVGTTPRGQWGHVVLAVDRERNALRGFLNGELGPDAPFPVGGVIDINGELPLIEGGDTGGLGPYEGVLDDFAIWDKALSHDDVKIIYDAGRKGLSFTDTSLCGTGPGPYDPLIGTDVEDAMRGVNATAYVRVPFHLSSYPTMAGGLKLLMQYDDGFRLYLNGVQVAERNAPDGAQWDSAATIDRPDVAALTPEMIDLTAFLGLLRQGNNVLAVHGLNSEPDAERFLVLPEQLCLERGSGDPPDGCEIITNGTDFWLAFPENYEEEPDNPIEISLCMGGTPGTFGIVEIPGLSWAKFFIVAADGRAKVVLPKEVELEGENDIEWKGVHVLASARVAVYGLNHMDYSTDAFLGLPMPCLGTEYLVLTYQNVHDNVPLLHGTELAVVSPQDATMVTITPSDDVGAHPKGVPYTITLNRGETYQLRNESGRPANMTGTEIRSDKPVGVFGAHRCANIASATQFFCDFIVEELLPVSLWGTSHYVVPLMTRGGDTVQVLAARDKTPVMVSGSLEAVLDAGEVYEFALENPGPGAQGARVYSDFPLLVAQYSNSADFDNVFQSDPFMTLIQPQNSWLDGYRFCAPPTPGFPGNYVNVVTPTTSELALVRLDGTSVVSLPNVELGGFDNGFAYARAPVPGTPTGAHAISGRPDFGLTVYGFAEFDSYGHPGGMRWQDTVAPTVVGPAEITIRCENPDEGCEVDVPNLRSLVQVYDNCVPGGDVGITQVPPEGEPLTAGTYDASILATDGNQNTGEWKFKLIVKETWEVEHFGLEVVQNPALKDTVWGPGANPDGDRFINTVEEKIGSDPNDPNDPGTGIEIFVEEEGVGAPYLEVRVRRQVLAPPGSCFLEGSRDLLSWLSGPDIFEELVTETEVLPGGEYEDVSFKARETIGMPLDRYFVRYQADP